MSPRQCPRCDEPVGSSRARFCSQCGAAFEAAGVAPEAVAEPLGGPPDEAGQHKFATVLFADIQGSTELAGSVDPEDWFEALRRFHEVAVSAVHDHFGVVASYAGDGFMSLFGAPVADEHHAQQACFAALDLAERARVLAGDLEAVLGRSLTIRIGINSGSVVVGRVGRGPRLDFTAQGLPVHIAARMEQIAEPGQILVARSTVLLAGDRFVFGHVGSRAVKGVAEPVDVYRLLDQLGSTDPDRNRGALVGRSEAMTTLGEHWVASSDGARVVLIEAEAGAGKSRLVQEFLDGLPGSVRVAHVVADSVRTQPPLSVAADLAKALVGSSPRDDLAGFIEHLAAAGVDPSPWSMAIDLLFTSTSAPFLGPEATLRHVDAFLHTIVSALATDRGMPMVLAVDDLHSIDSASRGVLTRVLSATESLPMLVLLTTRPGPNARVGVPGATLTRLDPLELDGTEQLIQQLSHRALSPEMIQLIHNRTGGNPFFIEETIRSLNAAPTSEIAVPELVQTVVAARIDRLTRGDREVLLAASVIGLIFDALTLAAVVGSEPTALADTLTRLVDLDLLMSEPDTARWSFRHRITQEVAYDTQLRQQRRTLHIRAAQALAEGVGGEQRAAAVAEHFDQAGDAGNAVDWYRRAAAAAARTDADEAVRLLRRVRALTQPGLTSDVQGALIGRAELLLQGARAGVDPVEITGLIAEIRVLAADGDQDALLAFGLLRGWYALNGAGLSPQARAIAEEAVVVADRTGIAMIEIGARLTRIANGNASGSMEALLAECDDLDRRLEVAGLDHGDNAILAQARFSRGSLLVRRGRSSEALAHLRVALDIADRVGDPMWQVLSRSGLSLALVTEQPVEALELAEEAVQLAMKVGGRGELCVALLTRGRLERAVGRIQHAHDSLSEALAIARSLRALTSEELMLAELADVLRLLGHGERARELAHEARLLSIERGNDGFELVANLSLLRVISADHQPDLDLARSLVARCEHLIAVNAVDQLAPDTRLMRQWLSGAEASAL